MICKVHIHPVFLICQPGQLQIVNLVSQSTMNGQIENKFYSNIPYMTCNVHLHPVFLLVDQLTRLTTNSQLGWPVDNEWAN